MAGPLTCTDTELPIEELFRRAFKQLPDGSWILQGVDVTGTGGGDFSADFSNDFNI